RRAHEPVPRGLEGGSRPERPRGRRLAAASCRRADRAARTGDPAVKVDLLLLGDGYTARERGKFEKDARRLVEVLFSASPFKERRDDFNVWALCPPAAQSG